MAKIPEKVIPHTGAETVNYGVRHLFEVFYSLSTETPAGARPLWTGEKIYNCKNEYKAFWNKALKLKAAGKIRVVDQATWDKEVAAPDISSGKAENAKSFGQTGAFVIYDNGSRYIVTADTKPVDKKVYYTKSGSTYSVADVTGGFVSGTTYYELYHDNYIQLPKITQFIQSIDGAAENGKAQLDAIRNIIGEFAADNTMIGTALEGSSTGPTGAFEGIEKGNFDIDSHGGSYRGGRLKLDASNVVPIADRVRPRNVQMALYIQVSNDKVDDAELEQAHLDRQYIEAVKTEINNIKKEMQNELILIRSDAAVSCMPDMSRAVFLEETDYSMNDKGCIFKINVPGWLVPMDRRTSYDGEYDWSYTFGQFPGYMFYGPALGNYGRWTRHTQQTGRFSPCGMVTGSWKVQFPYPIAPGDRCYFSLDDASSVNYQKQLWFVPSVSVPGDINKMLFVTRVGKKHQSPNQENVTANPILTDAKVARVFNKSASTPWTNNFNISGSSWTLRIPGTSNERMPFAFKTDFGTNGTSGWDSGHVYSVTNPVVNNPWKTVWWRDGGTYILRFIPSREIDDVIAEITSSSHTADLDKPFNGSVTTNSVRGWLNACRNRWVICRHDVYRKNVGGIVWWESNGHLNASDYATTNGVDPWSYWQLIVQSSKEANLPCPPIGLKDRASRWNAGYILRSQPLNAICRLNWVGVGARDTFGVPDTDKSSGISYNDIIDHQNRHKAGSMSKYEAWGSGSDYIFWK